MGYSGRQETGGNGPQRVALPYTPAASASNVWAGPSSYNLPYPNAPKDGSPQDLANTKAIVDQQQKYNAYQTQLAQAPTWVDKFALMANLGLATAGFGAALAPAASALAGGGTAGAIAGGAATGAATGGLGAGLTGQNIGKGVLTGGVLGGLAGGIKPLVGNLTGLTGNTGNIVNGGITGATTGAVRGALGNQGAAAGALGGLTGGVGNAAGNAIAGSIFSSGDSSNPSAIPSNIANPTSSNGTPPMSADPTSDPALNWDPTQPTAPSSYYNAGYPAYSDNGGGNSGTPSIDYSGQLGGPLPGTNPDTTAFGNQSQFAPDYLNNSQFGSALGGLGGSLGSSFLAKLLGGGGNGNGQQGGSSFLGGLAGLFGGSNSSLLAQLLGAGANYGSTKLDSDAAKAAAGQFANQTKFNPYGTTTGLGTTSYQNGQAQFNPSAGTAQNQQNLQGLINSSAQSLQGGQQGAYNQYYNQLQQQQRDANNKYYQNNLDSQFANGVLGSTAGQYQSQAALANISNENMQDKTLANNFANTQQQNQLAQLTAGLNGNSSLNQQQLAQLLGGGNLGSEASYANTQAYKPGLVANSNSTFGNILGSLGNQYNNSQYNGPHP